MRRLLLAAVTGLVVTTLPAQPVGAASPAATSAGQTTATAADVRTAGILPRAKGGPKPWQDTAWMPPAGPVFNDPVGGPRKRYVLLDRIRDAIDHTPPGATIRFAQYSFDRWNVADSLIKAHKRGVNVQIILNDNWTSAATARMRRELGTKTKKPSFVYICKQSCRGGPGNLHLKVYSFTQTGGATNVVMSGSTNITERAANLQYNDLYTIIGDQALFDTWVKVFEQLRQDGTHPKWIYHESPNLAATFYREQATTAARSTSQPGRTAAAVSAMRKGPAQDPVLQNFKQINCTAMPGSGNAQGQTVIRIIMYAWVGDRGIWLAKRMGWLAKQGCDVRAILSVPGRRVVGYLRDGGAKVRSADWKFLPGDGTKRDEDGMLIPTVDFYSHLKVLTVDGTFEGQPRKVTWTGSENWSGMSFRNDELTLQFNDQATYDAYTGQFNRMWNGEATHEFGLEPAGKPGSVKR